MSNNQPSEFEKGLTILGAVVGFLWGASVGVNDPELGFWGGAIGGTVMGAAGGAIAAKALSVLAQVALGLLFIGLILLRLKGIVDFLAS